MTDETLTQIERLTGFALPATYRRLLVNYPDRLIALGEFGPVNFDLYHVAEKLIEANSGQTRLWKNRPATFFVIGDNGCGNVYAIDTSVPDSPVYGMSPHHGEFEDNAEGCTTTRICDSVDEYAQGWRSP